MAQPPGQHLLQAKMRSSRQPRSQQPLPQPLPQPRSQPQAAFASQAGSTPQAGAGAAQVGAGAAQVGAGAAHAGAAQLGAAFAHPLPQPSLQPQPRWHRDLQHLVSQQLLSQPQPLEPSIKSSSSKE